MTICIARSAKTYGHYFFRIKRKNEVFDMPETDLPELLNKLTSAKSHKQLVLAIENACILFPTNGNGKHKRIMSPQECLSALRNDFEQTKPRKLAEEMFLSSAKPIRANSGKISPAAEYDAYKNDFESKLAELDEKEYSVVVEPVQDWMAFRNLLAIGAALRANIEDPKRAPEALTKAGFFQPDDNSIDAPIYIIQYKYQASTWLVNFIDHPIKSSGIEYKDHEYLSSLFSKDVEETVRRKSFFLPVVTRALGGDEDIFIVTHYYAKKSQTGVGAVVDLLNVTREKDRYLYLCIIDRGSELDMAKRVYTALWNAFQGLMDEDGTELGMTQDAPDLFAVDNATPAIRFHSLMSRLWNVLTYHNEAGRDLIACENCGCGYLAPTKGPHRVFCSDSCRKLKKAENG